MYEAICFLFACKQPDFSTDLDGLSLGVKLGQKGVDALMEFGAGGIRTAGLFRTLTDCWVSRKGKWGTRVFSADCAGATLSRLFSVSTSEGPPFTTVNCLACLSRAGADPESFHIGTSVRCWKMGHSQARRREILEGVGKCTSHGDRGLLEVCGRSGCTCSFCDLRALSLCLSPATLH